MPQERILVVQSEGIIADDIRESLGRLGYIVSSVLSGEEAVRMCGEQRFDLVLMDVSLPGAMDGVETAVEIGRRYDIPIVFLTGSASEATVERAKQAKPFAYLLKPFDQRGLHSVVDLAIYKHQAEAAQRRRSRQERELIEEHLRQAQKLEVLGRLASRAFEEIRHPVEALRKNSDLLEEIMPSLAQAAPASDGPDSPSPAPNLAAVVADSLHKTKVAIRRIDDIIESIGELAKTPAVRYAPSDMNRVVESTVALTRGEWRGIADLLTDLEPEMPPVACSANDLRDLALHLILNAAQATAQAPKKAGKGIITIRTRRSGRWAELLVSDTGPGLPPAGRDGTFDPFLAAKTSPDGSGMGLVIAQTLVVKHCRGTMSFEEETLGGTRIRVRLPLDLSP